ncbi:hypothetical protein PR202_gb07980 [Eleusine coracana subsp. coracana]|uniref:Uncharacterized protein n=1 Tax=Eleusine coracana subsp. coracana TaxID=191504 RepID=A0AAV5EE01_ELECO|nr:hypothetical protein PR202_gb07980 [Eleusine coracana subsp. coracana]
MLLGKIPTGNQLQTLADPSIYSNNYGLCGFPLSISCSNGSSIQTMDLKKEFESIYVLYWIIAGLVFGLCLWFGSLFFSVSWRNTYFRYINLIKQNS